VTLHGVTLKKLGDFLLVNILLLNSYFNIYPAIITSFIKNIMNLVL
jgi:hypothetical protein